VTAASAGRFAATAGRCGSDDFGLATRGANKTAPSPEKLLTGAQPPRVTGITFNRC
jgi:hypothetical protein